MIIRELRIESFGVLRDVALQGLGPGVQVVYGHNEAGKTTLLEFIRGVLFGFESRARYLCETGQILAGRLVCDLRGQPLVLSRRFSPPEGESREIRLGEQGLSEPQYRELLRGFDETVFCSVFAITLDELARLRTLDEAQAADQFYDLSLGLDRGALQRLFTDIRNRRENLLNLDTQSGEIPHLIAERQRLERELENASHATEEYARLRLAREELLRAKTVEEATVGQLSRRLETLRMLDALAPQRERIRELQSLVEVGPPLDVSLKACLAKAERERKRLHRLGERIRDLSARRRELKHTLSEVSPRPALLAAAPATEGIRLNLPAIRQWSAEAEACHREMADLAEKRRALETELVSELQGDVRVRDEAFQQVHGGGCGPTIDRWEFDAALKRRAGRLWREVRMLSIQYRDLKRRLRPLQAEHEKQAAGLRDRAGGINADEVACEIQRLGDQLAKLRKLEQIRSRVREAEEERESARRELLHRLPEELPLQKNVVLGIVFVAGLSLALAAGLGGLGVPAFSGLGWIGGLLGGVAAAMVPLLRSRMLAQVGRARADAIHRLETVEGELRGLKAERDRLEAELDPLSERPAEALTSVENRLRELQDLRNGMDQQLAAERTLAEHLRKKRAVGRRLRQSLQTWRELFRSAGWPGNPAPRRWPQWRRRLKEAAALAARGRETAMRLQRTCERLAGVESRLDGLANDAGVSLPDGSLEEKVHFLLGKVEESLAALQERRKIRRALSSARRALRKYHAVRSKAQARLKRLYRRAGVEGYSQLRAKIEDEERRSALREELDRLNAAWQSAVQGIQDQELRELASLSVEEVRRSISSLQAELETRRSRLSDLLERLGRVSAQVESLAADRSAQFRAMEWASVASQTARAARDWWIWSLGQKVLDRVRFRYQKERQPELLREASEYWRQMTGGRFLRVWTPLERRVLLAEDVEGRSYELEQLSRGTREQLFLCLRLALAGQFARRLEPIPLILDDVLVNFDQIRAESACEALMEFAGEGRQVLLFTCHDHVAELFSAAGAAVCRLEDRRAEETPAFGRAAKPSAQVANVRKDVSDPQSRRSRTRKTEPSNRTLEPRTKEAASDSAAPVEKSVQSKISRQTPAEEDAQEWFAVPEPYPVDDAANSETRPAGRRSSRLQRRRNRAA